MTARVLFVHNYPTRFVTIDLALLRECYTVREWYQRSRAVNLVSLARAVQESDLIFGWFASWHSLFPMLLARAFKRRAVLVVGGYDTANMPDIQYGNLRGGVKGQVTRTAIHSATRLMTNSHYVRDELVRNATANSSRVSVIYHGLDPDEFSRRGEKQNLVVTVGNVERGTLQRKGIEAFTRAAAFLPDVQFAVIGAWRDAAIGHLRAIATPNVTFTGWVDEPTLRDWLSRARVYVQASRDEAFGLAVAEAMLCECVPVVTRAGGLPEVAGEAGVYVDSPAPQDITNGIKQALELDASWGSKARERILEQFPLEKRRAQLYALIEQVLNA